MRVRDAEKNRQVSHRHRLRQTINWRVKCRRVFIYFPRENIFGARQVRDVPALIIFLISARYPFTRRIVSPQTVFHSLIQSHPRLNFANAFFQLPRSNYSAIWRAAEAARRLFNTRCLRNVARYLKDIRGIKLKTKSNAEKRSRSWRSDEPSASNIFAERAIWRRASASAGTQRRAQLILYDAIPGLRKRRKIP